MPFCPNCGGEIEAEEKFCYECGQKLPAPDRSGKTPDQYLKQELKVDTLQNNTEVLHKFKMFALLEVFGLSFFFVAPLFAGSLSLLAILLDPLSLSNLVTTAAEAVLLTPALMIIGLAFGMIAVAEIRSGFKELSKARDGKFSTASTLSIALIVGLGLYFIALVLVFLGIFSFEASLGSTTFSNAATAASLASLEFLLAGVLLILGTLSTILGGIGVVVGLWQLGDRYEQGILKVAAILQIIPYAFLLSGILTFVGAHSASADNPRALLSSAS